MYSLKYSLFMLIGFTFSIFIFLNGILMNRSEVHDMNTCPSNAEYCRYSPYKKIILLLVDALKYDFIDPSLNQSKYYQGNLDVIRIAQASGKKKFTYLNHFISDPPTTTLQRIKGITTGSLPTFIDISTNFGSSELMEDNIVLQWQKFGFDIKFAGDDTWTSLFPGRFNKSEPYPSFNVKDLDTVDKGVEKFLIENLSNGSNATNQKPEILLGHLLGIDHCGHTYGKNHPQMKRKLNELNDFLKRIVSLMDKDTLLVVFGDHGMTSSGDHGGESEEEIDAALFMISEKPLNFHRQSSREQSLLLNLSQIDIVPTLAAMTGVAIPFSNLGVLRPEMLTSVERANQYLQLNIKQIAQYISVYQHKFGDVHLPSRMLEYLAQPDSSHNTEQSFLILKSIQSHFRSKWAQFNVPLIYGGILSCFLYLLMTLSHLLQAQPQASMKWRYGFYVSLMFLQIFISDSFIVTIVLASVSFIELVYLTCHIVNSALPIIDIVQLILVLISSAYILVPLSNSFIVSEDNIVQYFLQTVLVIKTAQCIVHYFTNVLPPKHKKTTQKPGIRLAGFLPIVAIFLCGTACLVFGMIFQICREEQRSWCEASDPKLQPSAQLVILIVPLLLVAHRFWLAHCGNLSSNQCNVLSTKCLLPLAGICLFFHHCLQFVDESSTYIVIVRETSVFFPRMAVLFSLLSLVLLFINPLLMRQRKRFDNLSRIDIPSLFNYLREKQSDVCESVVVHGLGTIYSSAIFTALLSSTILVLVFLKVQFVLGITAMFGFLFVYSILATRLITTKPDDLCAQVPVWEWSVVMTLLTQYGFFSTGHQATISNIPWYAAFIGWSGDHVSHFIPAVMVNINIFSSHILISVFGLLIPLLVLSISVGPVRPWSAHSSKKKKDNLEDKTMSLGDFYFFSGDEEASRFSGYICRYYVTYLVCQSVLTLGTMISAGYGRRHLMAWKIFVPKMMYSVASLFVVYLATAVGYLLIVRIHRMAVEWRRRNT